MDHIQDVLHRAHLAIDRATALTSEVRALQLAADQQQLEAQAALLDAAALRAGRPALLAHSAVARRPDGIAHPPAEPGAELLSGRVSQQCDVGILQQQAHNLNCVPRSIPAGDWHSADCRVAVISQQRADSVAALAVLRRRQLRLRRCQLRALRCLLTAEPQLSGLPVRVRVLTLTPQCSLGMHHCALELCNTLTTAKALGSPWLRQQHCVIGIELCCRADRCGRRVPC